MSHWPQTHINNKIIIGVHIECFRSFSQIATHRCQKCFVAGRGFLNNNLDNDRHKIPRLIIDLQKYFKVCYNEGLKLYTIRHYTIDSLEELIKGKTIILEQKSRNTVQIIA